MAPCHIRKYQESDRKLVVDLFYKGMVEHAPATFRHVLMLPRTLVFLVGVQLCIFLTSGSWLLVFLSSFTLLVFLRLLAGYPWKQYVLKCLHTDLADITKTYLSASDSCFWVAESGGQVVGTVCVLPVENPPPGKKQLELFHLSVSAAHRGEGIAKALIRIVLQFARDQGFGEVVLDTSIVQQSALALYRHMGFQETRRYFFSIAMRLVACPTFHLTYQLPIAGHGGAQL